MVRVLGRRSASAVGFVAAGLAYVGGYYRLIDPVWLLNPVPDRPAVIADYKFGGAFATWLFHPMNVVDRRLRPEWWAGFPATPPWERAAP